MITARTVTLRNGSKGTITPYHHYEEIPKHILHSMHETMNDIIRDGKTYPIKEEQTVEEFIEYYCKYFVAVLSDENDNFIGSFYIKPNYVGRSSHVCNGGFIVDRKQRGLGAASLLGETYGEWAPLLGYKSSVFNLVFVSNIASVKIWDKLGYTRAGLIRNAGLLRVGPNGEEEYVDAIVFQKLFV
ncbi:hypothetical protein CANINC_000655 [Pichia inconspicua]|uniref:N-acetyltransferase domain-containing protein n=1 Tax=Pichia inconspicua TaxID=52247 RepID=A0A4T0X5M2_9ASCO|nr:hypothetical protein CANINC_000655 [[Candida] inconspicua]